MGVRLRRPGRGGLSRTPPRLRLLYLSKLLLYKVILKVLVSHAAGQKLLVLALGVQAVCLPPALPLPVL